MEKTHLKKIQTLFGVTEYKLQNGLRVLYKKESTVPVVAVCVTYHVGSRNEALGHTGATHILEHLLFKDSKKFNIKNGKGITDYLEWFGARMNATTWVDRTNYFEMLPREHLKDALEMEADRMRNSLFSDADLASEMTVVRNEYERSRNNPFELLDEEVIATAFTEHPYRIATIGLKEDIENSTASKLREFYDRFYWPNNVTLTVMGDVSAREMETLVVKYFGPIKASPNPIPTMDIVEPEQKEPRQVTIKKSAGVALVTLGYKVPEATSPDYPALVLLGTVLAGGLSSRLQQKLVDTGLAADVGMMVPAFHDPALLSFTAALATGKPAKVLDIMRNEVTSTAKRGVTPAEVRRARERVLSHLSHERDGIFSEMRAVSEALAAGDWTLGYRLEVAVKKCTAADLKRVAKKYFTSAGETTGTLLDTQ